MHGTGSMTRPAHTHAARLRRAPTRDWVRALAGSEALLARGSATRHRDLRAMMAFAARRRLARMATGPRPPARWEDPRACAGQPSPEHAARSAGADTGPAPRLLERSEVTKDLLRLQLSRPPGFDYRPGQHVKMGVPGLLRTYSLVSAPHEAELEFFVELFPNGRLSQRLRNLSPGAAMALGHRAKGKLGVDIRYPTQLLIARVTGVAPYVSFLRHHVHRTAALGERRFVILHGASYADELGYADEIIQLARRWPGTVTYVPTVSRPDSERNAAWHGARGRVETHVEALLSRLGLGPVDTAVFACGNPGMVRNVEDALRRRGFAVHTEPFGKPFGNPVGNPFGKPSADNPTNSEATWPGPLPRNE